MHYSNLYYPVTYDILLVSRGGTCERGEDKLTTGTATKQRWGSVAEINKIVANILRKPLDRFIIVCYNKGTKTREDKLMKEKIIMIISILAFAISWGTIILAAVLGVIWKWRGNWDTFVIESAVISTMQISAPWIIARTTRTLLKISWWALHSALCIWVLVSYLSS